jgi:hypothetical protein
MKLRMIVFWGGDVVLQRDRWRYGRQTVSYFLVNSCRVQLSRAGTEIDQHGEGAQVSRYPTVNQSSAW